MNETITDTVETVNVTPVAFEEGNPNRAKNIRKFNKASEDLHNAVRDKNSFFEQTLQDHFHGIEGFQSALSTYLRNNGHSRDEADDIVTELGERWEVLEKQHSDATTDLLDSMHGR